MRRSHPPGPHDCDQNVLCDPGRLAVTAGLSPGFARCYTCVQGLTGRLVEAPGDGKGEVDG